MFSRLTSTYRSVTAESDVNLTTVCFMNQTTLAKRSLFVLSRLSFVLTNLCFVLSDCARFDFGFHEFMRIKLRQTPHLNLICVFPSFGEVFKYGYTC